MSALNSTVRYGVARPSGITTGLLISLLLHAMLIYGYRLGGTSRAPALAPPETMTVWLRPPPPAPRELPPPPPPLAARPEQPAPAPAKPRRKPADRPETAAPARQSATMTLVMPPAPAARDQEREREEKPDAKPDTAARGDPPDPFAEPAPPAGGKFDIEAARRTARKVANERDPAKAGTAVSQFPEKPLASETPLARSMGKAARADCKDGLPGGLLAPLLLLMDKKDSGCKW
ncbi:hypothetical protein [Pseudoduganella namucuonensis]|uniref:Uncharacterized protein n=1 Tax=Pseudoduganella namucuonensis TaxID=1035707 RepID=A0A1I7G3M5_9BURK|nr:hypothetical protein [Pseudoduganella namucuonensis]SFU42931.1 hypothetical protein SAMN05216552_100313 [Pseudoduganella namucuonensis]